MERKTKFSGRFLTGFMIAADVTAGVHCAQGLRAKCRLKSDHLRRSTTTTFKGHSIIGTSARFKRWSARISAVCAKHRSDLTTPRLFRARAHSSACSSPLVMYGSCHRPGGITSSPVATPSELLRIFSGRFCPQGFKANPGLELANAFSVLNAC